MMPDKDKLDQAMTMVARGDYAHSSEIFSQLILPGSYLPESFYGMGLVRFGERQPDLAQRQFESCLRINPQHDKAAYYLGAIAEGRGRMAEAQSYYQRCLNINPRHTGALQKVRQTVPQGYTPFRPSAPASFSGNDQPPEQRLPNETQPKAPADQRGDFYALIRSCNDRVEREMAELLDQIASWSQSVNSARLQG